MQSALTIIVLVHRFNDSVLYSLVSYLIFRVRVCVFVCIWCG